MVRRCPRALHGPAEPGVALRRQAGLRIMVPGWAQWSWQQRERALVMFGSFAISLGVGLFVWGTRASLVILAFACMTHVISAADVIRQSAFPGFGRLVPVASASAGLGLGCYGPAFAVAMVCAWPGFRGDTPQEGYLVNRGAYWNNDPGTGEWAWAQLPGWPHPKAVRVLAGPGQTVEWSQSGLRVGGVGVPWTPPPTSWRPREFAWTVPDGQVLVAPDPGGRSGEPKASTACGLVLVSKDHIAGRAWAKLYPIWDRGLIR
jgi:hypothetical protein